MSASVAWLEFAAWLPVPSAPSTNTPSGALRTASLLMPFNLGTISAISSQMSSEEEKSHSMPPLRASSAAIIQSLRAVPGGLTCLATGERRPSKFICVPSRSPKAAAGSTMEASLTVSFAKASMAMMLVPTARASLTSCLFGKSRTGSAPKHTSTAISPAAA